MVSLRLRWRWLAVVAGLGVVALGLYALGVVLAVRSWHRAEASYHHEMAHLSRDHERKLHAVAERLRTGKVEEGDPADEAFPLLRLGFLANNSKEVDAWEHRPPSPERTEVARKWVEFTAAESAAAAARHEIWARDHEHRRRPHHIADSEVPEPAPPAGWTEGDWKWGGPRGP